MPRWVVLQPVLHLWKEHLISTGNPACLMCLCILHFSASHQSCSALFGSPLHGTSPFVFTLPCLCLMVMKCLSITAEGCEWHCCAKSNQHRAASDLVSSLLWFGFFFFSFFLFFFVCLFVCLEFFIYSPRKVVFSKESSVNAYCSLLDWSKSMRSTKLFSRNVIIFLFSLLVYSFLLFKT